MAFMALNNVGLNRRIKIIPFVKEEAEESEESDVISKGDFRNLEDYDSGDSNCGDSNCGGSNCGGGSENQDQEDQEDQEDEDEDDPYFEEYNAAHLQTPVTPLPVTSWVRSPQMFKNACEKVYQLWHYQLAAYIVKNTYMPCLVENPVLISYIVSETMYGPLIPRPPNAVMLACKMHDDEYFLRHNIENPFDKIKREAAAFKVKELVDSDAKKKYKLI